MSPKMQFLWPFMLLLSSFSDTWGIPLNVAYPDSQEMYSYKSPRTMNELKQQHMRQAMVDVGATIKEVQNILRNDPSLPRLTNGEIEDLFEMVTREEYKRSIAAGDYERAKHMQSLMLVLPFNANSQSDERLQELFTRTPATKMVNIDSKKPKPQRIVRPASAENSIGDMTGAFSNIRHHQLPTTFKPASNYVTAPITTFHPKGNIKMPANVHLPISTYHPKTSVSKILPFSPTSELSVKTPQTYSSRFDATTTTFPPTKVSSMRPNVKKLLSTIGLEPDYTAVDAISTYKSTTDKPSPTTTTTTTTEKPELTPELKELLESFGLLTNEAPPAHITAEPYQDEFLPVFPSALTDESLSVSEFKPLPKSVTSSELDEKVEESFETKADDFSSFKPLPIPDDRPSSRNDDEFKNILETYGLIEPDPSRDKKAMQVPQIQSRIDDVSTIERTDTKAKKMLEIPEVDVQFLTPDLAKVLGDFGIKNIKSESTTKATTTTTEKIEETSTPFIPIVQPTSATMENDLQKLHHLLDTIKELDKLNANLTEEELDSLNPKNFNFSKDLSDQGPDPIESFYNSNYASKNEVKRQTNTSEPTKISLDITATTTSSSINDSSDEPISDSDSDETKIEASSTTESDAAAETTTAERNGKSEKDSVSSTTEESRNGNISDLADSFGGNDGLDPVSEEPLPPPKKNGFYFFSDWNSFLEVGLEDDKVEVRFDPKIGDPSPFIPVKIP